jgi:hypothetical protein
MYFPVFHFDIKILFVLTSLKWSLSLKDFLPKVCKCCLACDFEPSTLKESVIFSPVYYMFLPPQHSCTSHQNNTGHRVYQRKVHQAISVIGCGGPSGCETLMFSHFPDNRPSDRGEVVSLTCKTPFTTMKIPGTHFY